MAQHKSIAVVLFEDDPKTGPKLQRAIKEKLPSGSKVSLFAPGAKKSSDPYEDRLAAEVKALRYDNATLWVTDRDLSRTRDYSGLSEAIVSKVAAQMGVPICKYARGTNDDDVFKRQRYWGDAQIILESADVTSLASQVSILARGFRHIATRLKRAIKETAGHEKAGTPAVVMARLLDRPDVADKIALYGSGDQKMISEILPFAADTRRRKELQKRLPSLLGYWLYDSILRFPGVLMNSIATASYLNISVPTFEQQKVQKLFKSALYGGPFNDSDNPLWWRNEVDKLLLLSKAADGNAYATIKLKTKIPQCLDGGRRAGLYCMVKKVPVSESNSVGNISWFPPGADLARVRKDVFEQIGPWLGLF